MQKFESTLHFSDIFIWIQGVMLIGSVAGVIYLNVPWWVKITLIAGLFAYAIYTLFFSNPFQRIGQDADGWYLKKAGQIVPIEPLPESTVTSIVSILRFRQDKKVLKQTCLVFRDSMPRDCYRQFIVRMRYFKKNRENHPEIR
ncbi:MAG TPA: protein YgfX [Gammaproteobacteria bacterium]|nr:protein YgfX [Gammaproteobacteria bacterium]